MQKIDIHHTDHNYEVAVRKLKQEKDILSENRQTILSFLEASALGKTARAKARKRTVGSRARLKNLYLLKIAGRYYKKSFKELEVKDIENFIKYLDSKKGREYSEETISNTKKQFIILLRWIFGENTQKFHEMTYWIDTTFKKKEVPSLTENDVKNILKKCKTIKQQALIVLLYDGGFRIEEALNVRNEDVILVAGNVPYYRVRVRAEFSKTEGREVNLLWSETYEILKRYIESKTESLKPHEPLFVGTYDGVRKILGKLSERTNLKLNAHRFRHSSSTHYANKGLNEFQINKRFGWSKTSNMGRYYVEGSKIEEDTRRQVKDYEDNKLEELKVRLRTQQEEFEKERLETKRELEELKAMFEKFEQTHDIKKKIPQTA